MVAYRRKSSVETLETFASTCSLCSRDAEFTRFQRAEHHTFFGIRGPATGMEFHGVTCGRCGHDHHVRDLETLDSPMLAELYSRTLRSAIAALDLGVRHDAARRAAVEVVRPFETDFSDDDLAADRIAGLDASLDLGMTALRDSCHVSIHRQWMAALIHVADRADAPDLVARCAQLLALSARDIEKSRALVRIDPEQPDS